VWILFLKKVGSCGFNLHISQVFTSTEKLSLLKKFNEIDKNSKGLISFEDVKTFIKDKNPNLYKNLKSETEEKLVQSIYLKIQEKSTSQSF
jgi:hypothetical protein